MPFQADPGLPLRARWPTPVRAARGYIVGVAFILLVLTGLTLAQSRQHELDRARQLTRLGTEAAARDVGLLLQQADSLTATLARAS